MASENFQMAFRASQIFLILGLRVLTTAGWHCGLGRATERASATIDVEEKLEVTMRTTKREELAARKKLDKEDDDTGKDNRTRF